MAWDFVAAGVDTEATSGDLTLTEPAGAAQGDLLVAAIAYRSNAAFTLPASWTIGPAQQSSGNTTVQTTGSISSLVMAYIVRGASAPSYVFTRTAGDIAIGSVLCYRGQKASSPYDTGSSATLGAASVTNTTGTITTAENGELLIAASSGARNDNSSAFDAATGATTDSGAVAEETTDPASNTWTQRTNTGTAAGADVKCSMADAIMTTAGATGTVQCTQAQSARHAMGVMAFKVEPAASGVARYVGQGGYY